MLATRSCSVSIPRNAFSGVLRYALTGVVHDPDVELRRAVALLGGKKIPLDSFGIVLKDTTTAAVHGPEIELGGSVAPFGGQAVPVQGFGIILWNAGARVVPPREVELRLRHASLGAGAQVGKLLCWRGAAFRSLSTRPTSVCIR